ncbi:patatin-like phospholipase family protein [Enterococcus nangangensis]|uniref:patatin-like phospholipase family protein n=1 Tax=Enterococcus nangangensis TaxID=2559926 RepID=UPI0010F4FA61|nr:patatin family protein [Enterococcus nangangensis]
MDHKIFSGLAELPQGQAPDTLHKGCIVLEGGAFRGVYGEGVLDVLMAAGINMECTIGCSAGAMNGLNYVAGQIGRAARMNLRYRHDSRYVGLEAFRHNRGVIGFDFVFGDIEGIEPLNEERFYQPQRRFVAVTANCRTGQAEYFEKGQGNILQAVQASASMPFVSKPVEINGDPFLDGGCCDKVPYQWAMDQGYEKIIVVRTREESYRKKLHSERTKRAMRLAYRHYPKFVTALETMNDNYNQQCAAITELGQAGRLFVISPTEPVSISRLEKDMEKLGALYYQGQHDATTQLSALEKYLAK